MWTSAWPPGCIISLVALDLFLPLIVCISVRAYVWVCAGEHRCLKRSELMEPLELKFLAIVSHLIWAEGTELQASARAARANCCVTELSCSKWDYKVTSEMHYRGLQRRNKGWRDGSVGAEPSVLCKDEDLRLDTSTHINARHNLCLYP